MRKSTETPAPRPTLFKRAATASKRLVTRDSREHLWAALDFLEARPALRRRLLIGLPVLVLALGFGAWGYERWARVNALRIARQWLDAGRLDRAAPAIQDAINREPYLPAPWRLASELAWKKGNKTASVEYARRAAQIGGYQADDVLAWAEASLLSDDADQAGDAYGHVDAAAARASSRAMRVSGEIARRARRFADARDAFDAALRIDSEPGKGPAAVDEVPLGIVCLQTGADDDRARGQEILGRWATDLRWGPDALRALMADAAAHGDRAGAADAAERLRAHPRCTVGDIPVCLQTLAEANPARYQAMLVPLENDGRAGPVQAAQLIGWLTQIGQGAEALRWGETLDKAAVRRPPLVVSFAEAYLATQRWSDLQAWADGGEWGRDLGFLGWAYGLAAARHLGDATKADALWKTLQTEGSTNPAHALVVGESLVAWGYPGDAAQLLWMAADKPELSFQALGSLVRLYQLSHDAVGQYRVFSRLGAARPDDRNIANNLAYFAAVTDLGSQTHIERLAADNFNHEPGNLTYRSTYAFVLVWGGQASRALALMEPVARKWHTSHAVAFAYGAALSGVGRKAEARAVFDSLDRRQLGPEELSWIQAALR